MKKYKIIQITAGRGPVECSWVVAKVLKVFLKEATNFGIQSEVLTTVEGELPRTLQTVTLKLEGEDLDEFLNSWKGTIQWVGTSQFRRHHKRKNWFIALYEMNYSRALEFQENEVYYQSFRSSGAGGQHVNKVNSAVRAIHGPSQIQAVAMDSRSQHQNKKLALQRLKEKVEAWNFENLKNNTQIQWEQRLEIERGNPVRVFTGTDFRSQKISKSYKSKRQQLKNEVKQKLWESR